LGISDREVEKVVRDGGEGTRQLASRKMEEVNHLILPYLPLFLFGKGKTEKFHPALTTGLVKK
jgi:hypothetical protein